MRTYHQLINREKYEKLAKKSGVSLGRFLLSNHGSLTDSNLTVPTLSHGVDCDEYFIKFADLILDMRYVLTTSNQLIYENLGTRIMM